MEKACTRTLERGAAATGRIDHAETRFEKLCDVKGVLLSLPALLANGLLKHSDRFLKLPDGYYRIYNIFLLLGFMALARVKNIERLRYQEPGEWSKSFLDFQFAFNIKTVDSLVSHWVKETHCPKFYTKA